MNIKIDVSKTILKTSRIRLRPFQEDDLLDLYRYACDGRVTEMAGWPPHKTLDDSLFCLHHYIEDRNTFALEIDGHVFGSISIGKCQFPLKDEDVDKKCVEVGYVLAKELWGHGLMPEALSEVIRWLFCNAGCDIVFSGHFKDNPRSKRVQEKCGFRHYLYQEYKTKLKTVESEEIMFIKRDDVIYIDHDLSLVPYFDDYKETLKWYQDLNIVRQVDNDDKPYTLSKLERMYDYLDRNGDLYYIRYQDRIVGDITLLKDGEIAIVINGPYQNRHIGRRCLRGLIAKAKKKGFKKLKLTIYPFNIQSQKMARALGFERVDEKTYYLSVR